MQQTDGRVVIAAELDTDGVTEGIDALRKMLSELKTYTDGQFRAIRTSAVSELRTGVSQMPGIAENMTQSLASALNDGRAEVRSAAGSVISGALGGALTEAKKYSTVGVQMVSGIISGLNSASSSLYAAMRSIAAEMVSVMKESLAIHSPSTVMRDEVGVRVGEGIAVGVLDTKDTVNRAVTVLAEDAVGGGERTDVISAARTELQLQTAAAQSGGGAERTLWEAESSSKPISALPAVTGNTFVFNKPVQTPYAHAKAIQQTMEAMLYGT